MIDLVAFGNQLPFRERREMFNNHVSDSQQHHRYKFEQIEKTGSIRTTSRANEASEKFLARVKSKVEFETLSDEEKVLINEYMMNSVLNIEWYQTNIKKERRYTWFYSIVSFLLLFGMPFMLFFSDTLNNILKIEESYDYAGLLMVVVSSIIAIHKAFSEWFKKRLRKGKFWEASSKIKENLYKLEGEFDGLATKEDSNQNKWVLTDDFKIAVHTATAECRKIASDEQQVFLDKEMLPNFEFGKALTTAKADATSLISGFRSSTAVAREEAAKAKLQAAADLAAKEDAVAKAQAVFDSLDKMCHKISDELKTASADKEFDLEARLKTVKSEREKAFSELLEEKRA